jgi:hypothetical protein
MVHKFQTYFLFLTCIFITWNPTAGLATNYDSSETPEFAVVANKVLYIYSSPNVDDSLLTATVIYLGDDQWQLSIQAKRLITDVIFPWQSKRKPLDNNISDDIFYYPFQTGQSEKAANRNIDWTWFNLTYPGGCFAPLVVMADDRKARIVAAVNWPPRKVSPMYAAQRMVLKYEGENISAGSSITYRALISEVEGDASMGRVPWQLALDKYRTWLDSKMPPVKYPDWMQKAEGFFNVQLENLPVFSPDEINMRWNQWKELLPWILFWGQMSDYAGGCCTLEQNMHPRYGTGLVKLVKEAVINGYYAGYYSAPYYGTSAQDPPRLLDTAEGLEWLMSWISKNRNEYFANAFLVDVLGAAYWGNPEIVMKLFDGFRIPENSAIEWSVDIYPAANILSGSLCGRLNNGVCEGGPNKTPENSNRTTFIRFGRYLLGDRIVFLGQSNNDWKFWGPENNYWTERQAFLLGAKFDAITPNSFLLDIKNERDKVSWWKRNPRYLDIKDISNIPSGIEVRRFIDKNSEDLFVIDNWGERHGLSFYFQGRQIHIPSRKISIIDLGTVGVEHNSKIRPIKHQLYQSYPNPLDISLSNRTIAIGFSIPDREHVILKVFDVLGREAATLVEGNLEAGTHTVTFNTSNLPSGVYFYKLTAGKFSQTRKAILMK